MPENTLSEERMNAVQALVGKWVDPEIAKHNRYQHGFINGVITALNTVFGEEKPLFHVEQFYADEAAAAKNLGYEAMVLLQEMPINLLDVSGTQWLEKRRQLLECWQVNTTGIVRSEMMRESAAAATAKTIDPGVLVSGNATYEFRTKAELYCLPPVESMSKDGGGAFFRRLVLGPRHQGVGRLSRLLYAEHIVKTDEGTSMTVHRTIGSCTTPDWLNIEILEEADKQSIEA